MVSNFLFHRVNPKRDVLWDPMDISLFEKCIKYISGNFEVRQLEKLVAGKNSLQQKKKYATIVFDDGYKDNIEYAAPILDKYKIRASFYVVTDCIEKNIPTWTHILDHAFQFTNRNEIDLSCNFLPEHLKVQKLVGQRSKIEYVRKLKPALKKITDSQRVEVLECVQNFFNDVEFPDLMMNWNDLEQLKNAGHYIGSHTVSHSMLGNMNSEADVRKELVSSGKKIEERLGYFPSTISYPVGSYDAVTIKLSKEAGYKMGLAVKQKVYDPAKHGLFEIPRIELYNEPWLKTRLRIDNIIGKASKLFNRR